MDDLYYGDVYSLAYWDYLNVDGLEAEQQSFIRDGCLVILLAMGLNALCGASSFSNSALNKVMSALEKCPAEEKNTAQLRKTVQLAFNLLLNGEAETRELGKLSHWVHREFVRGYFEQRSEAFRTEPYFTLNNR